MSTEPWQDEEMWMNEQVCDYCREEPHNGTTELMFTGDQPPVYICSTCLIEATLEWERRSLGAVVNETNRDLSESQTVLERVYSRGLDIKVFAENRDESLNIGEVPEGYQ